jgi:hypothetical protein
MQLADNWRASSTEAEYIERGKTYMDATHDKAVFTTLFSAGEVLAAASDVPDWELGQAAYGLRIEAMAAQR